MRRQTLFLIPALVGALATSLVIAYQPLRQARAATSGPWRTAQLQGLTLDLPADAGAPVEQPGSPWSATERHSPTLGMLRVAREQPSGELEPALRAWFELPGPLDAPIAYAPQGQPAQAAPVHAFGRSGIQVRRLRRQPVAVCVFDLGGQRYWVQARAPGIPRAFLPGFRRMLLSMRGPGGETVDPRLADELQALESTLPSAILPSDPLWVLFIPLGVMLIIGAVATAVTRLSGRTPRRPEFLAAPFFQAPVEVLLAFQMQRKYFDAAVAVIGERLVVYTYGSPLLSLPLAAIRGNAQAGEGWFPPPYLEIALNGSQEFHKYRFLYGRLAGKIRLRIHTPDLPRLRMALGT
jgi:hypothetical protein